MATTTKAVSPVSAAPGQCFWISDIGVSDFGFRDSEFGILDSGFGFRDSGVGTQVSGFRFGVRGSGFGFRDSGFAIRVLGFGFRGSGFGIWVSAFGRVRREEGGKRRTDAVNVCEVVAPSKVAETERAPGGARRSRREASDCA